MNYVESFNLLGVEAKQIPCIKGEGAPTASTEGAVGCLYMDILAGTLYKCISVSDGVYVWATFEGKKGDAGKDGVIFTPSVSVDGTLSWTNDGDLVNPDPVNIVGNVESIGEIVQTTGDSETAVMSQKATTTTISDVKNDLENKIGNVKINTDEFIIPAPIWEVGGYTTAEVGSVPSLTTSTGYNHAVIDGVPNAEYEYCVYQTTSTKYGFYAYALDNDGKVVGRYAPVDNSVGKKTHTFITPSSTVNLAIMMASGGNSYYSLKRRSTAYRSLQTQIDDVMLSINSEADFCLRHQSILNQYIKNLSSNLQKPILRGKELIEGTKRVILNHELKNPSIKIAFITDTHKGGARTNTYDSQYNIGAFIDVANQLADVAVFGGDLITNYYDDTNMPDVDAVKTTLSSAIGDFSGLQIPLMVVKGNHDFGLHGLSSVQTPSSFEANKYYVYDEGTGAYRLVTSLSDFEECLTKNETFYTSSTTLISNDDYYDIVLANNCHGTVHGGVKGGYYYYDVPDTNLRLIFINEYYATSETSYGVDDEQLNFISSALDISKSVITFSHTANGCNRAKNLITMFRENGGEYIGHIHGHNHSDTYTNDNGYINIGSYWGCVSKDSVATYYGFSFNVYEIDMTNKLLIENRVGARRGIHGENDAETYRTVDRVWSFESNKLLN